MKEESRKVKYTKKIIKDSFLSLLKQKHMNKITIIEICEIADINRGTFYQHYENIDQLLDSIVAELLEKIREAQQNGDFFERMERSLHIIYEDRELAKVVLSDNCNKNYLENILSELKEDDYFAYQTAGIELVEYEYIFNAIVAGCVSIIKTWMTHNYKEPISFIIDLMKNLAEKL